MKRNFGCVLALSALILTAGCKKSIKSSVDLSNDAKASFLADPNWQLPGQHGRIIRFDVDDGLQSDCLLAYDIGVGGAGGTVSLVKFSGTTSTNLYRNYQGFQTDKGFINAAQNTGDIGDDYNEVGGMHIIPYDALGTGHEDHLLLYIPGEGEAWVIHWNGTGWVQDYYSASGIGGYDLKSKYDKIIAYDYGGERMNYLICYRPGSGLFWVLKNNSSGGSQPTAFSTVLSSSAGVGGFDLMGINDQIACIGGPSNGNMDIAAYRPGYGYVWFIAHGANSPGFGATFSTRTGLPLGWGLDMQDRMVVGYSFGSTYVPENDANIFAYRPGNGPGFLKSYSWYPGGTVTAGLTITGIGGIGVLTHNPYGSPTTYQGDHVVCFSGGTGGTGNTSLLFYTNNGSTQSQLYYFAGGAQNSFTQVY